jgi:hypothetical protein
MKHFWWDEWQPEPPARGSSVVPVGSEVELQKLLDNITAQLPDILSADKKKVITSKLQAYKNSLAQVATLTNERDQAIFERDNLQVWERNRDEIIPIVQATKAATEEKLKRETDDGKKPGLQKGIQKLTKLLDEISGLNLVKNQLKNLIKQRVAHYGYGNKTLEDLAGSSQNWEDYIANSTSDDFEANKSQLLKHLAELIIDHWLTNSPAEPKARLEKIDNYLKAAAEKEAQQAAKASDRASALVRLRNSLKSQKGTITLTVDGQAQIVDENNASDNRSLILPFQKGKLTTVFEDISAISKLPGIKDTDQIVIYFNFTDNKNEQSLEFKTTKDKLVGYENRQIVFHFEKLEEKSRKLVRIDSNQIHLDYNSYTRAEISGGTKLPETPKNWKDINEDFDKIPLWKTNWVNMTFSYEKCKEWIDIGLKPDEFKLAFWLENTKKGDYKKPEWVLDNTDITQLRKEWLEREISLRLNKYKLSGWDAEKEYDGWGKDQGHWNSELRGKTWKEYLGKINNSKPADEDELSFFAVKDGLLATLAEVLIPKFIERNTARGDGFEKTKILEYMDLNCSKAEQHYYDTEDGSINKRKEEWQKKHWTVRQVVNSLTK